MITIYFYDIVKLKEKDNQRVDSPDPFCLYVKKVFSRLQEDYLNLTNVTIILFDWLNMKPYTSYVRWH